MMKYSTRHTTGGLCLSVAIALMSYMSHERQSLTSTTTSSVVVTDNGTQPMGKARVLFIPWTIANSHVTHHYRLADELIDDGYDVHVLRYDMVDTDAHTPQPPNRVKLIAFDSACDYTWVKPYYHRISWAHGWRESLLYYYFPWLMLKHRTEMCDKLAPHMIDVLRSNDYTAVIVDTSYMPCTWMIVNQLKVPYAIMMGIALNVYERQSLHALHTPYATFPNYMQHMTDRMRLGERARSAWNTISLCGFGYFDICVHAVRWLHDWTDTRLRPLLTFGNGHRLLDTVAPTTFADMNVNSITHGPRYQRHTEIADVNVQRLCDDQATRGIVIFSLSTMLSSVTATPMNLKRPLIDAFTNSPLSNYSLIYRRLNKHDDLETNATNIVQVNWFDIRAVMAKCNVRALITQGGKNSMIESALAAIPVIGIPLMVDQPGNMAIVEQRGLGYTVRKEWLDRPNALQDALTEVLTNESYRRTTAHYARMVSDVGSEHGVPTAFWLRWFVRHGCVVGKFTQSPNLTVSQSLFHSFHVDVIFTLLLTLACLISVAR